MECGASQDRQDRTEKKRSLPCSSGGACSGGRKSAPALTVANTFTVPNAFTVDVEDYYHVSAFESRIQQADWDRYPSRIEQNTQRVLALLRRRQVRATFFVLGWVAERQPDLVRRIRDEGHEIGAHSLWHRRIYTQSPETFQEETHRTKELLSRLSGDEVVSFRAPSFSITKQSWWALEILAQIGFRYDSSVFPIRHDRYGVPGTPLGIYRVETSQGTIWEFPPAVCRVGGMAVPSGGGGYFRLYPLKLTLWLLRAIQQEGRPFVFYVHPWELDPHQPRLPGSFLSRFRHYWNLSATARRLEVLLDQFTFAPIREVIETQLHKTPAPVEVFAPVGLHGAGGGCEASCHSVARRRA